MTETGELGGRANERPGIISWLTLIIVFLNFLFAGVMGVVGFYFVDRYEARSFDSASKLSELQSDIARLQITAMEERQRYEFIKEKLSFNYQLLELIENVKPTFSVELDPEFETIHRKSQLVFHVKNDGRFTIVVQPTQVIISESDRFGQDVDGAESDNISNVSTKFVPEHIGAIGPGQELEHRVILTFSNEPPSTLYYRILYRATTDKNVVLITKKITDEAGLKWNDVIVNLTSSLTGELRFE